METENKGEVEVVGGVGFVAKKSGKGKPWKKEFDVSKKLKKISRGVGQIDRGELRELVLRMMLEELSRMRGDSTVTPKDMREQLRLVAMAAGLNRDMRDEGMTRLGAMEMGRIREALAGNDVVVEESDADDTQDDVRV